MKTTTDHIRDYVGGDLIAYEALQAGTLNLRAYARTIKSSIEDERHEKVDVATMAVALSRIEIELQAKDPITPRLQLDDITTQAPLCEITYAKDQVSPREVEQFSLSLRRDSKDFVVVTQGFREVTIIMPSRHLNQAHQTITAQPAYTEENLCAITVHFTAEYLRVPNIIYALLAQLAVHRVNITEIVSTSTELSVITDKDSAEIVNRALQKFL